MIIKIGPAGDNKSGKAWDDRVRVGIVQIFVSYGDFINSLQFQFVENGTLVLSKKHGGRVTNPKTKKHSGRASVSLDKFSVVRLNNPSEFLTGINGYHGSGRIVSLAFSTNKGRYGPFGGRFSSGCSPFEFALGEDNTFGGFHGTASVYLNSIGVYMKTMTTLSNVNNPDQVHIKDEKCNVNNPDQVHIKDEKCNVNNPDQVHVKDEKI